MSKKSNIYKAWYRAPTSTEREELPLWLQFSHNLTIEFRGMSKRIRD